MIHQAVLLCAGLGTRMRPLTLNTPKPLVSVSGKPLLEYAFDVLPSDQINQIVVNAHYLSDQIVDYVMESDWPDITVSVEETLLDSGGGVKQALTFLPPSGQENEAVVTLNTDAVWLYQGKPSPFEQIIQAWNPDIMDALWLVVPVENTRGYSGKGDCHLTEGGQVQMNTPTPRDYVFTGLQMIKKHLFTFVSDEIFPMKQVWSPLLEQGRLHGVIFDGIWCDVGTPDGVTVAEGLLTETGC